jgi:hypothetical protein
MVEIPPCPLPGLGVRFVQDNVLYLAERKTRRGVKSMDAKEGSKSHDLVVRQSPATPARDKDLTAPAIVADAGNAALERFAEFFTANSETSTPGKPISETPSNSCAGARPGGFGT